MTTTSTLTKAGKKRRSGKREQREVMWFFFFISPWLIGFVVLSLVSLVLGLLTSFTNFDGFNLSTLKWVGLSNYARIFSDSSALWGLQRTAFYAIVYVPLALVISFTLAVLLNQRIRGRGFLGGIFYIPSILPVVAVAWMWKLLMSRNSGLVNAFISLLSPGTAINWLSSQYATAVLILLSIWMGIGGGVLIFLAALQGVPKELEEAALIDGATRFQMFLRVVVPLMTPIIFLRLVMGIIGALQVFTAPLLLTPTNSGVSIGTMPPRANYMFMIHAVQQTFAKGRYGYGAALVWMFFVLILVVTLIVFRTQRYWVFYEVEQEGGEA